MEDKRPLARIDYRTYPSYPLLGDLDKSFHRCECRCDLCEEWRKKQNRIIGNPIIESK